MDKSNYGPLTYVIGLFLYTLKASENPFLGV